MIDDWAFIHTTQFWWTLGSIILIDIILAGDNAIVIALVARQLPQHLQTRAIFLGTIGAIVMRIFLTFVAVSLLQISGLMLIGGGLLAWIAYKLLVVEEAQHHTSTVTSLRQALQTIMIADTIMSLDNVLAIAGTAQGNFLLVALGLLISIPLVVWGSTFVLSLLKRFSILIYLGATILSMTAVQMIFKDPLINHHRSFPEWLTWIAHIIVLIIILALGYHTRKKTAFKKKL